MISTTDPSSTSMGLAIRDLTYCYAPHLPPVLDQLTLEVPTGTFLSVVGQSGGGKSTLLRVAAGLLTPTAGEVLVKDRPLVGPSLLTSVVFQADNLLPWRTARGNVALGIETSFSKKEVRSRCKDALRAVGLETSQSLYPHQLSGGMRQRVNLARALARNPEVLLMDEPFSALDAQTRDAQQRRLLDIWQREQRTVFFVTHDIDEAVLLSDTVVLLGNGTIEAKLTVNIPRPRDRHVRGSPEFIKLTEELRDRLHRPAEATHGGLPPKSARR